MLGSLSDAEAVRGRIGMGDRMNERGSTKPALVVLALLRFVAAAFSTAKGGSTSPRPTATASRCICRPAYDLGCFDGRIAQPAMRRSESFPGG